MNILQLVIPVHSLYWSIHLWHSGVTALFSLLIHEIKNLTELQVSLNSWKADAKLHSPKSCAECNALIRAVL